MANPPDSQAVLASVGALCPDLEFYPSEAQRQLKARFWLAFKSNPIIDEKDVCPSLVEELTGKPIQQWMGDPQFWRWFATRDSTRQHLEAAAEKAASLALYYLDPSVPFNDNARVSLIKAVLDFSGRTPPNRKEIKWLDKEIADLSPEQLTALIAKLSAKEAAKELPEA